LDTFLALVEAGVVLVVVRRVERRMVIWWSKMGQGGMTGKQGKGWFDKNWRFVLEECSPFRPPGFRMMMFETFD
tara:strand:- start:201 stop:422 length:222 start_codon:yes stop_codon:yes gene_type:complete